MNPLNLTPLELAIFNHRLGVPDAIEEVFQEDRPDLDQSKIAEVICMITEGQVAKAIQFDKEIAGLVLVDVVRGSTFFGAAEHNVSRQKLEAIAKAGRSLARKVADLTGLSVQFPEG